MADNTYQVPFFPGDGSEIMLEITYISEFPRGIDGACAFCHGDPCAEDSPEDEPISRFFKTNASWAETCPLCQGRGT